MGVIFRICGCIKDCRVPTQDPTRIGGYFTDGLFRVPTVLLKVRERKSRKSVLSTWSVIREVTVRKKVY